jgi:hypothetical protein
MDVLSVGFPLAGSTPIARRTISGRKSRMRSSEPGAMSPAYEDCKGATVPANSSLKLSSLKCSVSFPKIHQLKNHRFHRFHRPPFGIQLP